MNYWLLKTEPFKYSWENLQEDEHTYWDGVRNYQARNNLQAMKKGDMAYIYHSNEGKEIVGIAMVIKESYPDPTIDDDRWVAVDIAPVKSLEQPISLKELKANPKLENMSMLRQGRLSVCPISQEEWDEILRMSESDI